MPFKDFKEFIKSVTDKIEKNVPNLFMKYKKTVLKNPNKALVNAIVELERVEKKIEKSVGAIDTQIQTLEAELSKLKKEKNAKLKDAGLDVRYEKALRAMRETIYIIGEKKVEVGMANNRLVEIVIERQGTIRTDIAYQKVVYEMIQQLGKEAEELFDKMLKDQEYMSHTFIAPKYRLEEGIGEWISKLYMKFEEMTKNISFYVKKWSTSFSKNVDDLNLAIDELEKSMAE